MFEKVQIYKMCIFCHENSTPTLYTWKKKYKQDILQIYVAIT